ncbi:Mu transposase C-terminal domain-containing protein [Streptomyces silvensis]|uniref:Transposase n=1 Tax=Streptomyces silvensis TaxID=1765722 RepID=A0A0W7WYX4_9ACTN|nr:Mu transposase C-terminal domain-containing protein [Streptomyces silvensis]KUF15775.1 transposase [Streptomyces silvensis]
MTTVGVRLGVGTRVRVDGETAEVVEVIALPGGMEVLLRDGRDRLSRMSVRELMTSGRAEVIPQGPGPASTDEQETAAVLFARASAEERAEVLERAAHVREVLYSYRSGSAELAAAGEPRPHYAPGVPLGRRYAAKAAELGVGVRSVERWAADFQEFGEAGLLPRKAHEPWSKVGRADPRWVETALAVMGEYAEQSRPGKKLVLEQVAARLVEEHGPGVVKLPSRSTGYEWLEELELKRPTFRQSSKRNAEIATRPKGAYGKLRPTRPGEYLLMDTTRLDVFALDALTLQWMQAELTVSMDWYTRCITGIAVTPVSTTAADVAGVLFQTFRPRPVGEFWPEGSAWPDHGIPRKLLVDWQAMDGPLAQAAGPALAPETLVVDHGKVYLSEHLTSVCRRMGISVQPARLRTGRDKGPIERFFRTMREDLLQALPGYKGPDVHGRGRNPEGEAFFFHHELEAIIREWVATVYHRRPHKGLVDPLVPKLNLSPVQMFEHGLARAGYVEVPRDPDLAYEFLPVKMRTVQHYGVEIDGRRYNGPGIDDFRDMGSSRTGLATRRKPFAVDPGDITRVYFRDPCDRTWHTLRWEHAPAVDMPLSAEALTFARRLARQNYQHPDDRLAIALLLKRWQLGLGTSLAERRIALRLSREQTLPLPPTSSEDPEIAMLPSVSRVLALSTQPQAADEDVAVEADVVDDTDDGDDLLDDIDFYATALKDVE